MDNNLQVALDDEDAASLAAGLRKSAKLVPDPSWDAGDNGWASIAQAGAKAAAAGDLTEARASCKACHRAFRKKYKADYRLRKLP